MGAVHCAVKHEKQTNKDLGLTIQKNGGSINQMEWQLVNRLGNLGWKDSNLTASLQRNIHFP